VTGVGGWESIEAEGSSLHTRSLGSNRARVSRKNGLTKMPTDETVDVGSSPGGALGEGNDVVGRAACAFCGEPLAQVARGRPRRFCGGRCRQGAHELRRWASTAAAGYAETWRAIGEIATADRILEEARLVEAGKYGEVLASRRAEADRRHAELAAIYRGRRR
jgi:endogenous inhibitor of DNA gyrase (YacG/DUF329 family)